MLEIDKDRTPLNSIVEEYVRLQREVKEREVRLGEIRELFKSKGTFATLNYVVSVKQITRTLVGPNDRVMQLIGRQKLEEMGLIYNSSVWIVSATPKGKRLPLADSV